MPPAISDGEEASDIDFDAPAPVTKKTNRDKKRTSYKDEEPEELKTEDIPAAEEEDGEDDEDGGEDDEEEEEEDVYVFPRPSHHGLCANIATAMWWRRSCRMSFKKTVR
jgi:hypothetical protein